MTATAILEKLNQLGVTTTVKGGRLSLAPASRIPPELVEAIVAHKQALILTLTPPEALRRALAQKDEEIATMRRRLESQYYADDPDYQAWCRDVIGCLQRQVGEIRRYLAEGGTPMMPSCCQDDGRICLIALRRFNGCLMHPGDCGFSASVEGS